MANTCQTCQYYYATNGECHRYPPVIVWGSAPEPHWSSVDAGDWCGEWSAGTPVGPSITLTSLTPNTLATGSTPSTVDVVGTGFDSTCVVLANGVSRATFYIDNEHLQYTARPDIEPAGTVQITVEGAGGTSNALPFTYT